MLISFIVSHLCPPLKENSFYIGNRSKILWDETSYCGILQDWL